MADQNEAELRPSTVHARFRALRALLNFLERRRKVDRAENPIHLVDAPSVPTEIRRHTVAEVDTLLAAIGSSSCLDHRDRLIVPLLDVFRVAVGELVGLRWPMWTASAAR